MPGDEIVWRLSGHVVETIYNLGRNHRLYWQVVLETDGGFACIYVRNEPLRTISEGLVPGDRIEASGSLTPHRNVDMARKPLFLNPVEQLVRLAP
jgi:hypothetical protein